MEDTTTTTAPARRSRALIALAAVIGVLVAIAAYSYGSASDRTPTARVQMVLDEDQTGWPFYAAVQEEAEAFIGDQTVLETARQQAGVSGGEIRVERPGDLSVFSVVATASDDDAAMALADAGAEQLIEQSRASRRLTESGDLAALEERRSALDADLDTISATVNALDPADQSAEAVLARSSLESLGRERNDVDRAIGDLETAIEATGPAYRALGPAAIDEQTTSALLTALTAGAAAAVLSLLALSFLAGPTAPAQPAQSAARADEREPRPEPATEPATDAEPAADDPATSEPVARSSAFAQPSSPKSRNSTTNVSAAKPPKRPSAASTSPTNGASTRAAADKPADSAKRSRTTRRSDRKR